jgi:hypothetical protein
MGTKPLICQSCGKPLELPADHGTNADGSPSTEYCAVCFKQGAFTQPLITMDQMITRAAAILTIQLHLPQERARDMVSTYMPKLKRWNGGCK